MSEVSVVVVRRRRSREAAERLVLEFAQSGLTRRDFCAQHGLSVAALDQYRKRCRTLEPSPKQPQPAEKRDSSRGVCQPHCAGLRFRDREGSSLEGGVGQWPLHRGCAWIRWVDPGAARRRSGEGIAMLGMGAATHIYVATGATDMRLGFNGLSGLVMNRLQCDPLIANARRDRMMVIYFDGSGLWVCAKRMEGGRLRWPQAQASEDKVQLSREEFALLIGGIDLAETRPRKWYCRAMDHSS